MDVEILRYSKALSDGVFVVHFMATTHANTEKKFLKMQKLNW